MLGYSNMGGDGQAMFHAQIAHQRARLRHGDPGGDRAAALRGRAASIRATSPDLVRHREPRARGRARGARPRGPQRHARVRLVHAHGARPRHHARRTARCAAAPIRAATARRSASDGTRRSRVAPGRPRGRAGAARGPAGAAEDWGGIEPGVTTDRAGARALRRAEQGDAREGRGLRHRSSGSTRARRRRAASAGMTVDFGLLTPQGYKPDVVRVFRLEPKPTIFGKNTVIEGWGVPDAHRRAGRAATTFFYKVGLVVIFDKEGTDAVLHDLHACPQPRPRRPARAPAAPGAPKPVAPPAAPVAMIDQLLALDPGGRGIARFFVRGRRRRGGPRAPPARGACCSPPASSVGPGLPETDGPPGAACLGRALRALGAEVTYVTDAVGAAAARRPRCDVLGEPAAIADLPRPARPTPARARRARLLAEHAPTHLVAIERPGPHARRRLPEHARRVGRASGTAPLDELFLGAPAARGHRRRRRRRQRDRHGQRARAPGPRGRAGRARIASVVHGRAPGRRRRVELGRLRHRGRAGAPRRRARSCTRADEERRMVERLRRRRAPWTASRGAREPTVDALAFGGPRRHA